MLFDTKPRHVVARQIGHVVRLAVDVENHVARVADNERERRRAAEFFGSGERCLGVNHIAFAARGNEYARQRGQI